MAAGDIYRVAFLYSVYGQGCANIMYMKQDGFGGDDATDAAEHLMPILRTTFVPVLPRGVTGNLYNVGVSLVSKSNSDQGGASADTLQEGPLGGALPALCSIVVRIKTGLAGRRRRGRIFVSGIPEGWSAAGVLNAAGVTGYTGLANRLNAAFMGTTPSSGFRLGVFSRTEYDSILGTLNDAWKPATTLVVPTEVASMRSRKVGVGQ